MLNLLGQQQQGLYSACTPVLQLQQQGWSTLVLQSHWLLQECADLLLLVLAGSCLPLQHQEVWVWHAAAAAGWKVTPLGYCAGVCAAGAAAAVEVGAVGPAAAEGPQQQVVLVPPGP